jgi:hypothetical protein
MCYVPYCDSLCNAVGTHGGLSMLWPPWLNNCLRAGCILRLISLNWQLYPTYLSYDIYQIFLLKTSFQPRPSIWLSLLKILVLTMHHVNFDLLSFPHLAWIISYHWLVSFRTQVQQRSLVSCCPLHRIGAFVVQSGLCTQRPLLWLGSLLSSS